MGVSSTSIVRETRVAKAAERKEYEAEYRRKDHVKARRALRKLAKCQEVQTNSKNPARHKSGKLSPKENGSTSTSKTTGKRNKNPCNNCRGWHDGKCPEPQYRSSKRRKCTVNKQEIADLFD